MLVSNLFVDDKTQLNEMISKNKIIIYRKEIMVVRACVVTQCLADIYKSNQKRKSNVYKKIRVWIFINSMKYKYNTQCQK